ncbi:MAG: hypothetical protein CVV44_13460 [Spirochaetae bacterium HGW-Spirochaetae-1]|jgi:biopolymer transport protein ExbB|nr:MAG: hypothetical protein CVV44_13460 [Spirochaetae bacterium HGW-Spirochaetae-1]
MTGKFFISIFDSIPVWVMLLPIFICSVTVLAVFVERMIFYRRINIDYRLLISSLGAKIEADRFDEAKRLYEGYSGPLVVMIREIVENWKEPGDFEMRIRDMAERAIRSIEKYGSVVATIATVSPMFGLLGTVTGMMKSFSGLASMGPSAHDLLAMGITEALVTTALGLLVAIPSLMFYNFLVGRIEIYIREVEYIGNSFIGMRS